MLVVPLIILGLLGAHLGLLVRQKHTQFPGHGRTEKNVVGSPMYPTFIAKTTGFLFVTTGVLWALGGLAQINPIWQFGQYEPYKISYAVQPDWYMGWLDGALRIMPPISWTLWGHTIPLVIFFPAVLFPGICFNLFYVWPFVEAKVTGDRAEHNLLDRPRDKPKRTAIGVALADVLLHAVRGELDRRARQLLQDLAQRGPVVLPLRRLRHPERGRHLRLLPVPRDVGRAGHRPAQAGCGHHAYRRGRVRERGDRAPAR